MPRIGVIGGTGFAPPEKGEPVGIETPYGRVEARLGDLEGIEALFVPRHRDGHAAPPHRIDARANVEALARAGVERVLAVNAVGSLVPRAPAGSFVVPDDYVDLSWRLATFYDDEAVHVDVTEAYCPAVRAALVEGARAAGVQVLDGGVYCSTPGPRLETRAEVRMLRAIGGTVVGMTGCPEAGLARERCLCYASLCVVANVAAGMGPPLRATAVADAARAARPAVAQALAAAATRLGAERSCACPLAVEGARL